MLACDNLQVWLRAEVTDAVYKYINELQHPTDCNTARKLLCDLDKSCGFGCQVHHVVHCLAHAVALNRTLVLRTYPSNYIKHPTAWNDQLQPVGSCAVDDMNTTNLPELKLNAREYLEEEQEVSLPIIDNGASEYDPPAVPQDVLEAVQLFNARPHVW